MSERLDELAGLVGGRVAGDGGYVIADVVHDSRDARPGTLFVAIEGFTSDGHDYAEQAAASGAALCLGREMGLGAPSLLVDDTRTALGPLAAEVHGHPARSLDLVGVTGTNGKTMVAYLLGAIWAAAGRSVGIIGTLGASIDGRKVPQPRTTPEASDLQRLLAEMVADGVQSAVLEASSHGIALERTNGMEFDVAAFTNLSRDHLDFHGDMDSYFAVKARLFAPGRSAAAVIWVDDPWGLLLAEEAKIPTMRVGERGEISASNVTSGIASSSFDLVTDRGRTPVRLPLGGSFNVANALVAAGCALASGLDEGAVASGLAGASAVPGRYEVVGAGDPTVIVDYAHTPDGVTSVIATTRPLTQGRVIVVLGAGGDRDPDKRPSMGEAAATADVVFVTNDNPRGEDPQAIIDAVASGARTAGADVVEEPDRRAAITKAVAEAEEGDVVLVLGKGHEQGQQFADHIEPFDDRDVARQAAAK